MADLHKSGSNGMHPPHKWVGSDFTKVHRVSFIHGGSSSSRFKEDCQANTLQNSLDWNDNQFRYDDKEDVFRLFFIKTGQGVVHSTCTVDDDDNIFVERDTDGKIAVIGFRNASNIFSTHFYDASEIIDGKGPLSMSVRYSSDVDVMVVRFVDNPIVCDSDAITDDIIVDYDDCGHVLSLEILSASKVLLKKQLDCM
mmetsp:Transcript_50378/g.126467  ORF Transcript_50378/g.126467 Transcript_50378/m.126467 type:complete len:197 (+) Transcript_50378:186-776(+)